MKQRNTNRVVGQASRLSSRASLAMTATISSALGIFSQCGACAASAVAPADLNSDPQREWAMSLRWENDTFGGTDKFYTDGVALGISHTGPSWLDPLADWLPWGDG